MNTKWVRAALIKNLPKSITQNLAIPFRQTQTIDAVYNLVKIYMHDHSTGVPEGQGTVKLFLTEANNTEEELQIVKQDSDTTHTAPTHTTRSKTDNDFNVAVKGDKKGGQGKGYGARWHCGVWGHPRRECPELVGAQQGTVNALKGKGKGFKGGKGKGHKGGKGKGFKGGNWNYKGGNRSPGNAIGKGAQLLW